MPGTVGLRSVKGGSVFFGLDTCFFETGHPQGMRWVWRGTFPSDGRWGSVKQSRPPCLGGPRRGATYSPSAVEFSWGSWLLPWEPLGACGVQRCGHYEEGPALTFLSVLLTDPGTCLVILSLSLPFVWLCGDPAVVPLETPNVPQKLFTLRDYWPLPGHSWGEGGGPVCSH